MDVAGYDIDNGKKEMEWEGKGDEEEAGGDERMNTREDDPGMRRGEGRTEGREGIRGGRIDPGRSTDWLLRKKRMGSGESKARLRWARRMENVVNCAAKGDDQ